MKNKSGMKRRRFLAASAATGIASSFLSGKTEARKPAVMRRTLKRDFIKVGIAGLGPYSLALDYACVINDISVPPRTNMRVVAVWGRDDGYIGSFKGTDAFIEKQIKHLGTFQNLQRFTQELGVEHVVKHPEDMIKLVDAVFVNDPENSLALARPFLEEGKPVFINSPVAWSLKEIYEILRLAKEHKAPLVTGSCIPWKPQIQALKHRINLEKIQHYYAAGTSANFVWYMPDILEPIQMIIRGKVMKCSTHGVSWKPDEDPLIIPPIMVHLEYETTSKDRDPVIGVASNWRDARNTRFWIKVHLDDEVLEEGCYEAGDRLTHDELLWLPFLRVIDRTFETGVWPEDEETIIQKVAVMLMSHKSGVEGGRTVSLDEIEHHTLPRFITEKA